MQAITGITFMFPSYLNALGGLLAYRDFHFTYTAVSIFPHLLEENHKCNVNEHTLDIPRYTTFLFLSRNITLARK